MTEKTHGKSGAAHGKGAGQTKMHTITNVTTGETKQVSQSDWKANKAQYLTAGFSREDGNETLTEATPVV